MPLAPHTPTPWKDQNICKFFFWLLHCEPMSECMAATQGILRSPILNSLSVICLSAWDFMLYWTRSNYCCMNASNNSRSFNHSGAIVVASCWMSKCRGGWPYKTSKEYRPIAKWYVVLYQYSANGNHLFHYRGQEVIMHRRNGSTYWFRRSVWPFVWGR